MKTPSIRRVLPLLALVAMPCRAADPVLPQIRNLVAAQRPNTFFVDVSYDLVDPDSTNGVYILAEASSDNRLQFYARYNVNSGGQTHEVGSRAPNRWGLHDMHGNVWEWSRDWAGNGSLPGDNITDPQGPSTVTLKMSPRHAA